MCTVSFIKRGDTYFITSNRDEHISRRNAFEPKEELINGKRVVFPKDPRAGGTWFAVNEDGVVAVLLNGANEPHIPTGGYARSRGLIVLEVVGQDNPEGHLSEIDLDNIEPFTLLVFQENRLSELRWDGHKRAISELKSDHERIWSSVTLYDKEAIEERELLFKAFLKSKKVDAESVVDFHSNNHGDLENGFIIDRATGLKTFSVTQVMLSKNGIQMVHHDLLNTKKHKLRLRPLQTQVSM